MRSVGLAGVVVGGAAALLASCAQLPRPVVRSERAVEAQAWHARWAALEADRAPLARKARARLAYEALTMDVDRALALAELGADFTEVERTGRAELAHAAIALPDDAEVFELMALWHSRLEHNPRAAVQAACRAAAVSGGRARYIELCGDALKAAGEDDEAVEKWKAAVAAAAEPEHQFALLDKIELTGHTRLNGLPEDVVRRYRSWKLERARR
ncbi:MAG: hypothetical protein ACK4N5_18470 [Myxococcales bacterium]